MWRVPKELRRWNLQGKYWSRWGVHVVLPMTMYVDNTGAIDLAKNWSTTGKTKHIDVRFHYLRELVDQGMLDLQFVRSEDNVSASASAPTAYQSPNFNLTKEGYEQLMHRVVKTTVFPKCKFITRDEELQHGWWCHSEGYHEGLWY